MSIGRLPERPNGADCNSAGVCLRRFESYTAHQKTPSTRRGFFVRVNETLDAHGWTRINSFHQSVLPQSAQRTLRRNSNTKESLRVLCGKKICVHSCQTVVPTDHHQSIIAQQETAGWRAGGSEVASTMPVNRHVAVTSVAYDP